MMNNKIINELIYKQFPNDQLIAFAILSIKRQGEECTFERLVKECYDLFPKNFSFYRYPQWPDSIKVDRPLRDLRIKRLITGSNKTKFDLTGIGEKFVLQVEKKLLGTSKFDDKIKIVPGRKEKRLFDSIISSDEYKLFISGKELTFEPKDFNKLFFGTLETSKQVIQKNIEYLIDLSKDAGENELLRFLYYCKEVINGRN